jgi:two-component system, NtrC family, response regulator HydG
MKNTLNTLQDFFDCLEEGIVFLNQERQAVAINTAASRMLGHERQQVIGTLCPSLFKDTHCSKACSERGYCSLTKSLKTSSAGSSKTQDLTMRGPDGSPIYLRMWATILPPEESLAYAAIVLWDRTREVTLEEEVSERLRLGSMIGHSPVMQEMFNKILRAANSDATVLITGESGVGKELVAHALHENSPRCDAPYIRVHCAALPETLLESELFGYAKGAFTGAKAERMGRFEAANGGTILLDEIGEIPLNIQVKLLRVLQEREVERLGENEPRKVNVRILAATNKDLVQMVQQGTFREDLYYRLRVLPVQVPPLRERLGDIPLLAHKLLEELMGRYNRGDIRLAQESIELMEAHDWPGNIREMSNALEYAMVHLDGTVILPRHLPPEIARTGVTTGQIPGQAATPPVIPALPYKTYYRPTPPDEERQQIMQALEESGGNRSQAARTLGMSRTTLWKRLKEYGLD